MSPFHVAVTSILNYLRFIFNCTLLFFYTSVTNDFSSLIQCTSMWKTNLVPTKPSYTGWIIPFWLTAFLLLQARLIFPMWQWSDLKCKVTVTKETWKKVDSYRGKASIIVWESEYYCNNESEYRNTSYSGHMGQFILAQGTFSSAPLWKCRTGCMRVKIFHAPGTKFICFHRNLKTFLMIFIIFPLL